MVDTRENHRGKITEQMKKCMDGGAIKDTEYTFIARNGRTIDSLVSACVLKDASGKPIGFMAVVKDITELKRTQTELKKTESIRESAQRLQTVIDSAEEGITLSDAEGHFEIFNAKMYEITGYTREEANTSIDFTTLLYYDPHERKKALGNITETVKKGVSRNFETIIQSKDGTRKTLLVSTSVIQIDDRNMFLSVYRDITERKNTENELRESEERFRTIFDGANDGLLLADIEKKKFFTGNKTICNMLGYSIEEIKNLGIMDIHPKEDLPFVVEQFEKQERREIVLAENIPMKRKDGSVFYADINSSPMTLAGKTYLMGSFRDITKRKNAEEALRESEERHRVLFESSRDAIMTLEPPSWSFTSGNPATVQMFKAKNAEEFISYGPGDLSPEHQPDGRASAEKAKEMIEKAMREGSNFFEWTHKRITGEEFPATVLLSRVERGGKVFLQATVRDITAEKCAEDARQKMEDELKRKIDELERYKKVTVGRELQMIELKKQIQELEEKLNNTK